MDPESQELQLRRAGVPWENLFRDIGVSGSTGTQERRGWRRLDNRLAGGDTLVVAAIDRIGRTWQDTVRSICALRDRGVKIRSLAEAEAQWTRYLEADEGSPESFFGQILTMFAAWVADQELESIKRRTRDGLERARQQGKVLGPPRKVGPGQLAAHAADAGRRHQPPDDRQRLRVLTQHRDAGAAAGGSGTMMTGPCKRRSGTWSCRVAATNG